MAQLRRDRDRLDAERLQVLLVGMGNPEESERFRHQFRVPFPMICDPDRVLHKALSIPVGSPTQVVGPAMVARGLGALLRGNLAGRPVGDVMQMPGAVGVGTTGEIWYVHTGTSAADHATVDQILAAWRVAVQDA